MQIKSIREASLNEKAFEGPNYLAWYKSSKIVPEKIHKKPSLNNKIQLKEATRKWISTRAANEEHAWQLNYLNTKRDWVKTPQSHTKKTRKPVGKKTKNSTNSQHWSFTMKNSSRNPKAEQQDLTEDNFDKIFDATVNRWQNLISQAGDPNRRH